MTTWAYPILNLTYGESEICFTLIPHRSKNRIESKNLICEIEKSFYKLTDSRQENKEISIKNRLMFSQCYELLLHAITEAGYIYNQECFIGLRYSNSAQDKYYIDELPFLQPAQSAFEYMKAVSEIYNPLYIINPLGSRDINFLSTLNQELSDKLLLGTENNDSSLPLEVITPFFSPSSNGPRVSKKLLICPVDLSVAQLKDYILKYEPEFVQTRLFI